MRIQDLLAKRAELKAKAEALCNKAADAGRDFTSSEKTEFESMMAEIKTTQAAIDRRMTLDGVKLENPTPERVPNLGPHTPVAGEAPILGRDTDGQIVPIFAKGHSVEAYLRNGGGEVEGGATFGGLVRAMCLGGGGAEVRAALAEGTDSAGGLTVPTRLAGGIIDRLRARSVMFQAGARTVLLDTGKATTIAAITGDPTAAWRAENADVALSDMTFAPVSFVPKSLAVMVVASRELLEDSMNLDEALNVSLSAALGGEVDRVALIGSGTGSEPKGVSKVTGVGSYSMGDNGAALTNYDPFVEALGILQTANAQDPTAVILAPRTNKEVNLLKSSTFEPLPRPKAIENLPFLVTSKLPITETQGTSNAASRAVMGYFPDVLIGIRSQLRIEILREKFADKLQYGILAHLRADVAVAHAANFCNIVGIN